MSMKPNYRCVISGMGNVAWRFDKDKKLKTPALTHFTSYARNKNTTVVGVYSPNLDDKKDFAQYSDVKFCNSFDEILALSPHIVSICSPSEFHFKQTMICIKNNVPMIWLEKPPTTDLHELDELINLNLNSGSKSKITVNYMRRYWQTYLKLKDIYATQKLGKPLAVNIIYSKGLENNGSHLLDFLFFMAGKNLQYKIFCPENSEQETSPSFQLKFANGLKANIAGIDSMYNINDINLFCENGKASILSGGIKTRVEIKTENKLAPGFYLLKEDSDALLGGEGFDNCFSYVLNDLIHAYETNREPKSNLVTARNAQSVIDVIRKK